MRHPFHLSVLALAIVFSGCATTSGGRSPSSTPNERLGSIFYDGSSYAGSVGGLSFRKCSLQVESRRESDEDLLYFYVSGKPFMELSKDYPSSVVLELRKEALVFIGRPDQTMEHPGREHVFSLHNEKAKSGDSMVKLTLYFEESPRVGFWLDRLSVTAGQATRVIQCQRLSPFR